MSEVSRYMYKDVSVNNLREVTRGPFPGPITLRSRGTDLYELGKPGVTRRSTRCL